MAKGLNGGSLPLSGGTLTGDLILSGDPTVSNQAANKNYVDTQIAAVSSGIDIKESCYAGTTANLAGYTYNNGVSGVGATLTAGSNGAFATDGVSPALNARILVKNQTAPAENGIYNLTQVGSAGTPAILTRASDYNAIAEINPGNLVIIEAGTTLAVTSWLQTATVATIGTDSITFVQFTGSASAPTTATYILQTANGSLPNAQATGALATGILKNTTITGVLSIAANGTDYYGPSTPTPVAVADGGTGRNTGTTAYGTICAGTTATGAQQTVSPGTSGKPLVSGGASALPSYTTLGVDGGGTGVASLTAYAVMCGGATSTGAVQSIASVGTSGQVLTSNGAGALPTFQANSGGSGTWVLLSTATASSSASIDFTSSIDGTYDMYAVAFQTVQPATNGVQFWSRMRSGGSFRSTAGDYTWAVGWYTTAASGENSSSDTEITLVASGRPLSNTSTKGVSGLYYFSDPDSTTTHKRMWGTHTSWDSASGILVSAYASGWLIGVTTAVDGIQFLMSSGNISVGTFQLYGIKKT